jgi:hypothetical protein
MSTDESEVERHAGIDMVPIGESSEMNSGPDDAALGLLPPLWATRVSALRTFPEMVMNDECF